MAECGECKWHDNPEDYMCGNPESVHYGNIRMDESDGCSQFEKPDMKTWLAVRNGTAKCDECQWMREDGTCGHPSHFGHTARGNAACMLFEAPDKSMAIAEKQEQMMQILSSLPQIQESITALAEMLRITNERMQGLEAAVRTLEKVTPQQATRINKAVRGRALEICADYRMEGNEKPISAAIRKTIQEMTGARAMREVARCDYDSVIALAMDWDDYDEIQKIKRRANA